MHTVYVEQEPLYTNSWSLLTTCAFFFSVHFFLELLMSTFTQNENITLQLSTNFQTGQQ